MRKRFVIPATVEDKGEMKLITDFPDFTVYSDKELGEVLGVSTMTIWKWRKGRVIPFTPSSGYNVYDVNKVIDSLKAFGYCQQSTGQQPTGHNHE